MIRLTLSERDLEDVAEALEDPAIEARGKIRLLVIRMHHENVAHGVIARCLKVSDDTVTNLLKLYQAEGLGGLLECRYYRPSSSLAPFWKCLQCVFRAAPVANAKEAARRIEQLTGIGLSESQSRRTMKTMGLELRKCGQIPGKADPQLQLDFYTQELLPRLEEAKNGVRKVFFVDAAHFVLGAFLGMVWCVSRVFIKTSPGRQRYSVLGAVDSHSKELIRVSTTGNINAERVCELLTKVRQCHPQIALTLVLDNARYQRCRQVMEAACGHDIELLFLPAYSPNLNLIERLWKLVKKQCLLNRHHPDFATFRTAIDSCLDDLQGPSKPALLSLLSLNFQFFNFPKSSRA